MAQNDFISSLLTDGAKFLRIADDVHDLMDKMQSISMCMYALTAGVYLAIVVYVIAVCYKERRSSEIDALNMPEQTNGGGGSAGYDVEHGLCTGTPPPMQPETPATRDSLVPRRTMSSTAAAVMTAGRYSRHTTVQQQQQQQQQQYSSTTALNELDSTGTHGGVVAMQTNPTPATPSSVSAVPPSIVGVSRRITRYTDVAGARGTTTSGATQQSAAAVDFDPSAALTVV